MFKQSMWFLRPQNVSTLKNSLIKGKKEGLQWQRKKEGLQWQSSHTFLNCTCTLSKKQNLKTYIMDQTFSSCPLQPP